MHNMVRQSLEEVLLPRQDICRLLNLKSWRILATQLQHNSVFGSLLTIGGLDAWFLDLREHHWELGIGLYVAPAYVAEITPKEYLRKHQQQLIRLDIRRLLNLKSWRTLAFQSQKQYSVFGSALTIGGLIGSIVNGKITDLIGRRKAFWLADFFFTIGWLAIAFSNAAWSLDLGRLSLGIAIGLTFYVAPVYVAEIAPKDIRGALTLVNQLMVTSGILLMYVLGTVVSWRTLALIAVVPCFVQVLGIFFIPESPRWLAMVGREKEIDAALQKLRGRTANISQESANIKVYTEAFQQQSEEGIFNLFRPRYANALIVSL
ncbi:hypothetical protein Patl1_22746 [Pistacia atlantica]|uniref:Uncharacterized protein n=1 Tax=Pistacia atlantica TaxID=434234 RepID=A0ACC1A0L9_9ROSI|nr:hypothetical protein Patl1_22746 [Pistacia atlantica]